MFLLFSEEIAHTIVKYNKAGTIYLRSWKAVSLLSCGTMIKELAWHKNKIAVIKQTINYLLDSQNTTEKARSD